MNQHTPPLASRTAEPQTRRGLPCWAMLLLLFALVCVILAIGGALVVRGLPSLLPNFAIDTPVPPTPVPTYHPNTPLVFGLSGQATCRNTKPPTDSPWLPVAINDAQKYQIDTLAFIWQIWQESKYNPDAVSSAGAVGIAQFLPSTAAGLGIDPHDPAQSLDAAAQLDSQRLQLYADRALQVSGHYGGASAHYAFGFVLAAYDAGAGAVETAWSQSLSNGWPTDPWDWLARMREEPRHYVPAILACL